MANKFDLIWFVYQCRFLPAFAATSACLSRRNFCCWRCQLYTLMLCDFL